jgi:hypothetical protein
VRCFGLGFRESAPGSHGGGSGDDGSVVLRTGRKEEDGAGVAVGVFSRWLGLGFDWRSEGWIGCLVFI